MWVELNLQTPFIITVVVKHAWWVILTLLSSLFRLRRPFPYLWGFGTFPWRSIGLWTCNVHINLPLNLLHQLPQLCHLPHPALPRARSAHLSSQSLKSCAPHIRWLWSSLLVPSLELLLKVCAHVCWWICSRCICLPSALHELNFNNVFQGLLWCAVEWGWGKGGLDFCLDWAAFKLCSLPCWEL